MKFSSLQILAIVCILAVGFMTAAPFVQNAAADPYIVPHYDITIYTCQDCGRPIWASGEQNGTYTVYHDESSEHSVPYVYSKTTVPCGLCDTCEEEEEEEEEESSS